MQHAQRLRLEERREFVAFPSEMSCKLLDQWQL